MADSADRHLTLHLLLHTPPHEPRENDAYYHLFEQTRRRLAGQGLLRCAIPGCTYPGPMELHHSAIEFSLQGGVDLDRFNEAYGLHLKDDAEFRAYIESPGALEVLCPVHHRTHLGIHSIPEPLWKAIRVWRTDLPPPAEVVAEEGRNERDS